jgi:hypothetical protein
MFLKELELKYSIRPLDVDGVAESCPLETNDLDEALVKLQTLLKDSFSKYVIVATNEDDE